MRNKESESLAKKCFVVASRDLMKSKVWFWLLRRSRAVIEVCWGVIQDMVENTLNQPTKLATAWWAGGGLVNLIQPQKNYEQLVV
jgi:hypothetical protein